jgi:hypothetical protein
LERGRQAVSDVSDIPSKPQARANLPPTANRELRELYVALRRAQESLREAHHALALVAVRQSLHARFRHPRPGRHLPDQGSAASIAQRQAVGVLQERCRGHLENIRLLKEENRRLCEDVARQVTGRCSEEGRE